MKRNEARAPALQRRKAPGCRSRTIAQQVCESLRSGHGCTQKSRAGIELRANVLQEARAVAVPLHRAAKDGVCPGPDFAPCFPPGFPLSFPLSFPFNCAFQARAPECGKCRSGPSGRQEKRPRHGGVVACTAAKCIPAEQTRRRYLHEAGMLRLETTQLSEYAVIRARMPVFRGRSTCSTNSKHSHRTSGG